MSDVKQRAKITHVERRTNSHDGNPRWEVHTTIGIFRTKDDGAVNYAISRALIDKEVELTLDSHRRIVGVQ